MGNTCSSRHSELTTTATKHTTVTICQICKSDIIDVKSSYILGSGCNPTCKDCIVRYLNYTIHSAETGTCPVFYCACEPIFCKITKESKKHRIVDYSKLDIFPEIKLNIYEKMASSLLTILCGTCHKQCSLLVKYNPEDSFLYTQNIKKFSQLEMSLDDFYNSLKKPVSGSLINNVLGNIANPERRANLQLRYYRDNTIIETTCCSAIHCFKCKKTGSHFGELCSNVIDSLNNDITICPNCTVQLVKSEGCNTVICPCGHKFDWAKELEISKRIVEFFELFPKNTNDKCAQILFDCNSNFYLTKLAKGWESRNEIEMQGLLVQEFKKILPYCPAQLCVNPPKSSIRSSYGFQKTVNIWQTLNKKDIEKCRREKKTSIVIVSMWKTAYSSEFENWKNDSICTAINQFVCLYGNFSIRHIYNLFENVTITNDNKHRYISLKSFIKQESKRTKIEIRNLFEKLCQSVEYDETERNFFLTSVKPLLVNFMSDSSEKDNDLHQIKLSDFVRSFVLHEYKSQKMSH